MGLYRSTYLGIYLKVKGFKRIKEIVHYENRIGQRFISGEKFCPSTGEPLEKIIEERENYETISSWDVFDQETETDLYNKYEDEFYNVESDYIDQTKFTNNRYSIFLVNRKNKYIINFDDSDDNFVISISHSNIDTKTLIKEFEEQYKEFLDKLRQKTEVVIHFGVVGYLS